MLDVNNVAFLFITVIILVVVMGMCVHGLFFFSLARFSARCRFCIVCIFDVVILIFPV